MDRKSSYYLYIFFAFVCILISQPLWNIMNYTVIIAPNQNAFSINAYVVHVSLVPSPTNLVLHGKQRRELIRPTTGVP